MGPLGRSLRKRIAKENPDEEFIDKEEIPLGYIWSESIDSQLNRLTPWGVSNPDAIESGRIAVRALTFEYMSKCFNDVGFVMNKCESPIEAIMLGAFVTLSAKKGLNLRLLPDRNKAEHVIERAHRTHMADHQSSILVTISPQVQIGDYRVDILLEYEFLQREFPDEAKIVASNNGAWTSRPEQAPSRRTGAKFVVECDGHEFHEKTKEQAAQDKRRDRTLQSLGFKVFRFTGMEINNDVLSCAEEVFDTFFRESGMLRG
jgi:very-short-patch-repair endonuclease